jgi:hypothetical protein
VPAERRVRTPALVFSDVGSDAADVLRRLEGAIERISAVDPGCALYNTELSPNETFPRKKRRDGKWKFSGPHVTMC